MLAPAPVQQDFQAISFPEWKAVLAAAALAPEVRERYRGAILTLLKVCKERRAPVSVALIREHLAGARNPTAAEALRWFYREGRRAATGGRKAKDGRQGAEEQRRKIDPVGQGNRSEPSPRVGRPVPLGTGSTGETQRSP